MKVATLAWPREIRVLPVGSGQGIAEMFVKKAGDEILSVIFDIPEIDTLTGLTGAQGSILLPTLKSLAMGEQLGQANANKDSRRIVPEHSYRACLAVGAQPGHTQVLFRDTTGGTPQRFLWVPVVDPTTPDGRFPEPEPLNTVMPLWTPGDDGVVEIVYGVPEIEQSILDNALARVRGEGDPLDGHSLLTRCKVAALLAIMHQRVDVTAWDWELSAAVMTVSNQTRAVLLEREAELRDNAIRESGRRDMIRSEGRERHAVESVKSSVIAAMTKGGGSASYSGLNSAMGKLHRRKLLPQALEELADERRVIAVSVSNGTRYEFPAPVQDEQPVQGLSPQINVGERSVHGERSPKAISMENRISQRNGGRAVSCQKWYDGQVDKLLTQGDGTVNEVAIRRAGLAEGYSNNQLYVAASTRRKREALLSAAG
ncbi:hypothetical protein [Mycobacterium mantenii]|uniref:hypothetical protein n=1 Tax=Mycobacterium mantenii TaxID=560555 RepID=UPI0010423F89|nr:hypothetical protein [Mycobacterium mantenii]